MLDSLESMINMCQLCEEPSILVPANTTREERREFLQKAYKKRCDNILLDRGYDLDRMKDCVEGDGSEIVLRFTKGMTTEEILEEFKRHNERPKL